MKIKRAYDDSCACTFNERDDCTLVVRAFDLNIRNKLVALENHVATLSSNNGVEVEFFEDQDDEEEDDNSLMTSLDSNYSSLISRSITSSTNKSAGRTKREDLPLEQLLDKDGRVIPYINFEKLDNLLKIQENKAIFDAFNQQLTALTLEKPSS
jgi:hypothetical protein